MPFDPTPQTLAATAPPSAPPGTPPTSAPSLPPPPDIVVTREDVLALPLTDLSEGEPLAPPLGHVWRLVRCEQTEEPLRWPIYQGRESDEMFAERLQAVGTRPHMKYHAGRPVWVQTTSGWTSTEKVSRCAVLSSDRATLAERAFLWQTAIASDAALTDIRADEVTHKTSCRRHVRRNLN
jgi:hypothetical protein